MVNIPEILERMHRLERQVVVVLHHVDNENVAKHFDFLPPFFERIRLQDFTFGDSLVASKLGVKLNSNSTGCARDCDLPIYINIETLIFYFSFSLSDPLKLIIHQKFKAQAHLPVHIQVSRRAFL
jgi:hypothetical protein